MTPRDLIAATGLSQSDAARALGVPLRTLQGWVLGERRLPEHVRRVLVLMQHDSRLAERLRGAADF